MALPERPLGEALCPSSNFVQVDPDREYRMAGIYSFGRGLIRRPTIRGSETAYSALIRIQSGQLTMSKLNAWEGALAIVPEEFSDTYVSPEYPVFDIDRTVADPSYIKYLVIWPKLWERLTPRGSMVRRKRTNSSTLMGALVPLPDLDEQSRIAARLDSTLSRVRRVEELQKNRIRLVTAFTESIISKVVESAAESSPVGEIMTLTRRQVLPEPAKTYREIGIRSFGRGVFHKQPATGEELGGKRVFAIEPGDLLFSNVFAWEGAVALAGGSEAGFIGSHRFMTYVVNESAADASYLRHYFTSSRGLEVIRRASPGSAGRNRTLGIKNFEAQRIPLPRLHQQRRIGQVLDTLVGGLTSHDASHVVEALRPSLLNAAFCDNFEK